MLVHGGPGRAGGDEEMGGKRGVFHYLQRTALQGSPTTANFNIVNNRLKSLFQYFFNLAEYQLS